jgi:hypothetical protein
MQNQNLRCCCCLSISRHERTDQCLRQRGHLLRLGHVGAHGEVVVVVLFNHIQDLAIQNERRPGARSGKNLGLSKGSSLTIFSGGC